MRTVAEELGCSSATQDSVQNAAVSYRQPGTRVRVIGTPYFAFVLLMVSAVACGGDDFKDAATNLQSGQTLTNPRTGVEARLHRKLAGTLDDEGWCEAHSTTGGFKVDLPGLYNDFSQTAKAEDGSVIRVHGLGTQTAFGAKFVVTLTERADGVSPEGGIEDLVSSFRAIDPGLVEQDVKVAGARGIELRLATGGQGMTGRVAEIEGGTFLLMVEYPEYLGGSIRAQAVKFFESFNPDPLGSE